jgi:hypothetical protein
MDQCFVLQYSYVNMFIVDFELLDCVVNGDGDDGHFIYFGPVKAEEGNATISRVVFNNHDLASTTSSCLYFKAVDSVQSYIFIIDSSLYWSLSGAVSNSVAGLFGAATLAYYRNMTVSFTETDAGKEVSLLSVGCKDVELIGYHAVSHSL